MSVESPATRLWRDALAQVDALLQRSGQERDHVLAGLAHSQPQLHSIVVSLLDAAQEVERDAFMEPRNAAHALHPGSLLGPYRIVSQIGAGGMGEVWRAKRDDGLYEGDVAIKTLHPYFAGGSLRERFLREAQLLGRLTHPNIARLLDAGVSPDGLVFIVLEYVDGVSIDVWCDERRLAVGQRLRLFMNVCGAVAHAHANLIVHRDIKPSNILVTQAGEVKLLDFGIAKLVEHDSPAGTELTRLTGRIFTPEYAAPEQILGRPITTATDVYALGVLLHGLLTGTRPYGHSDNNVEIERAVLHDEPARASRAIVALNAERIASARSISPARLRRALAGDLDSIIARALSKSPADRYASALALADDVRRHLDHKPIHAQPESLFMRTKKFARRHRAAVVASAVVVAALAVGVIGIAWQAQVARAEARKAGAIRDFLVGIFERNSIAHPDGSKARQTTAEELLAQAAAEIRTGLADAPEIRTELLGVIGNLYAGLEMQKEALPLLEERLAIQRRMSGDSDPAVARTLSDLAISQLQSGDYPGAERSATEALEIFRAQGDESALEHALAYATLGHVSYRLGTARDGRMRRYLGKARDLLAAHHPQSHWRIRVLTGLGRIAQREGDHAAAFKYDQEAAQLFESGAINANGMIRCSVYKSMGNGLNWLARNEEAEHYLRKAIGECEQAGGAEHPYTNDARRELGSFLGWIGRREEAKVTLERALQAQIRARGADDPHLTSIVRLDLGRVLMMRGEYAAAERELEHVIETWQKSVAPIFSTALRLAVIHTEQGRFDAATQDLEDIEAKVVKMYGEGSTFHAVSINRQGALYLAQGKLQDAQRLFTRTREEGFELGPSRAYAEVALLRIALTQGRDADVLKQAPTLLSQIESAPGRVETQDEEAAAHMVFGVALMREDKVQEAQPHLEKAVVIREGLDAPESLLLAEARLYLAQQRHRAGEHGSARKLIGQAAKAYEMQPYVGPQYRELLEETRRGHSS